MKQPKPRYLKIRKHKYTIRLLQVAEQDLYDIVSYIATERLSAAEDLAKKIEKNLSILSQYPYLGKIPSEEELAYTGYHYLVVQNYLIFYTIEEHIVLIHRILHGARDYLSLL